MNLKLRCLLGGVFLALLTGALNQAHVAPAAEKKPASKKPALQKFMRTKLSLSQGILEGLVTDDLERVERNANAMLLLTVAEEWKASDRPLYGQHSEEFRRAVKDVSKMAQKKNLDGAALNYLQVTMSCIECHRYVRNELISSP